MAYLRIGFADYELCPVPEGDKNLLHNNRVCVGKVDHYKQAIYYRDDLNGQCQIQTILHECIHVADWQVGTDDSGEFDKENQIDRYANFFLQFIRDNPDFVSLVWEASSTENKKTVKKGVKKNG